MTSLIPEEPQGGSPIGNLLSGSWELAQKILGNLSYCDVSKLRLVCRTWAAVGEMILSKRQPLHYLTIHPHCIPTTHGKVAIGEESPAKLFEGFFKHIVSKPRYCLAFCNGNWMQRTDIFNSSKERGRTTLMKYLRDALPSLCDIQVVSATGVIGTVETSYQGYPLHSAQSLNQEVLNFLDDTQRTPNLNPSKQAKMEDTEKTGEKVEVASWPWTENVGYSIEVEANGPAMADANAVSVLIIPRHPGVRINFFSISPEKFYHDFRQGQDASKEMFPKMSPKEFNEVTSLSPSDRLSALLLFDNCDDKNFTMDLVKAALDREGHHLALGGGVVDAMLSASSDAYSPTSSHIFGMAVTGPNILAASVVIPANVNTPSLVDLYMQLLKSCNFPERQSVAFMLTCCGRGYWSWSPSPFSSSFENVESKAFRKTFPNTPIFGFFGRGGIGITYLPDFLEKRSCEEEGSTKRMKPIHRNSTVIVLLSFL